MHVPAQCERAGFGEMSAADRFPQDGALPVVRKPSVRAASAMTSAREFPAACGAGAEGAAVSLATSASGTAGMSMQVG